MCIWLIVLSIVLSEYNIILICILINDFANRVFLERESESESSINSKLPKFVTYFDNNDRLLFSADCLMLQSVTPTFYNIHA